MKIKSAIFTKLLLSALTIMSITKTFGQDPRLFSGPVDRENINKGGISLYNPVFKKTIATTPNVAERITDGQDVRIFPSGNVQVEVHISINQNNPLNLIAACNTFTGNFNQGYYFSNDGGATWGGADQLQNSPAVLFGDPSTAFGADGRAYMTSMIPTGGYACQTSTNGGANWGNLITGVNQNNYDKEMIAADNVSTSLFANNFYCAWTNFGGAFSVQFNRSTNSGTTFTAPIILKNGFGQGTNVQTGPNGEVYVCWADYDGGEVPSRGLGFCRSLNGGASFTPFQRVLNYTGIRVLGPNPIFGNTRVNDFPAMAIDKSNGINRGRIYVCLPVLENGNGKSIIQVSFSDDQGNTFSNPTTVSIASGRQNWFPWITVDDCNGDVSVAYLTFDTQNGFETNTYVSHSADAGITWENQRVSDVAHITGPINNNTFAAGYAGDYIGITSFGGKAYPIWSDNRNGTWQLYCSPISFNAEIIGSNNPLCLGSSAQYSLSFLPCNSTVSWSTNKSLSEVSVLQNGLNVTITNNTVNIGSIVIIATITNSNGSTSTITKTIVAGLPYFGASYKNGVTSGNPVAFYFPNQGNNNTFNNVCLGFNGVPNVYIDGQPWGTNNISWSVPNGYASSAFSLYTGYGNRAYFGWNYGGTTPPGYIQGTVNNGCGTYSQIFAFKQVNCGSPGGNPCPQAKGINFYTISPNPANDVIKIGIGNKPAPIECNNLKALTTSNGIIFSAVNVYDNAGTLVKSYKTKDAKNATIQIGNLIAGSYLVEIIQADYIEKQQIIIQK